MSGPCFDEGVPNFPWNVFSEPKQKRVGQFLMRIGKKCFNSFLQKNSKAVRQRKDFYISTLLLAEYREASDSTKNFVNSLFRKIGGIIENMGIACLLGEFKSSPDPEFVSKMDVATSIMKKDLDLALTFERSSQAKEIVNAQDKRQGFFFSVYGLLRCGNHLPLQNDRTFKGSERDIRLKNRTAIDTKKNSGPEKKKKSKKEKKCFSHLEKRKTQGKKSERKNRKKWRRPIVRRTDPSHQGHGHPENGPNVNESAPTSWNGFRENERLPHKENGRFSY